ncbi:MAG: hypothetical protein LZF60_420003 [Nitrospira sp.]|nr:MAG: hypothetical protein LZF60_420003 [Nitrospira sp.]
MVYGSCVFGRLLTWGSAILGVHPKHWLCIARLYLRKVAQIKLRDVVIFFVVHNDYQVVRKNELDISISRLPILGGITSSHSTCIDLRFASSLPSDLLGQAQMSNVSFPSYAI